MGRMGGSGGLVLDIASFRQNGLFLANARHAATNEMSHEQLIKGVVNSGVIKNTSNLP
jgi:hypothetical protein